MEKLKPRIRNSKESKMHFLYVDSLDREWSVVNFEKLMENAMKGDKYSDFFNYNWEAVRFVGQKIKGQFRGMTLREVIEQIEETATK